MKRLFLYFSFLLSCFIDVSGVVRGNMTYDGNALASVTYNALNLPSEIRLDNGYVFNRYDAYGKKWSMSTGYRALVGGLGHLVSDYYTYDENFVSFDGLNILTDEGYVSIAINGTPTYHFYLRDHLGNIRVVFRQDGTVEQRNDYYPSGALMATSTGGSVQPYKYNGKELNRTAGLDHYDYGARWMDPKIGARFTTIDPMCEKYYHISPYTYCAGDPVNAVDPDGRDWYQNNQTKYYTWFENRNEEIEGYSYIGGKGTVLGEFEFIIDNILTNRYEIESLYSDGFTFDIAPTDKGALLKSKERDWGFLDEFVNGSGPEFSVLLADHPYTQVMMEDDGVLKAQSLIREGKTNVRGQITNYSVSWGVWDYLTTPSLVKQFIGSYTFDAFTSKDGKHFNNIISDTKSLRSAFYHLTPEQWNKRRSERKPFSNTYQFYIWKSPK